MPMWPNQQAFCDWMTQYWRMVIKDAQHPLYAFLYNRLGRHPADLYKIWAAFQQRYFSAGVGSWYYSKR